MPDRTIPPVQGSAELRRNTRVSPALSVNIYPAGARAHYGVLRDVSMGGLFVEMDTETVAPVPCRIEVLLDAAGTRIAFHGRIARVEAEGIAVEILLIDDLDSYQHLFNLVRFNSHDVEQVEREMPIKRVSRQDRNAAHMEGTGNE